MHVPTQRGFSLIEVMVALALLAGILVSIAGLFSLGGQQVKAGRSSSEALSIAGIVLEEVNGWPFAEVYRGLGVADSATQATVDSRTASETARWQQLLGDAFEEAYLEVRLTPLADVAGPDFSEAVAIRVQVVVHWREGLRDRHLELCTVRA